MSVVPYAEGAEAHANHESNELRWLDRAAARELASMVLSAVPIVPPAHPLGKRGISSYFDLLSGFIALPRPKEYGIVESVSRLGKYAGRTATATAVAEAKGGRVYPMGQPTELMVVGTHLLFRECLASMLDRSRRLSTIYHGDLEHAVEICEERRLDILLLDLNEPVEEVLGLIRCVRQRHPGVTVMILAMSDAEEGVLRCIEAGAAACVSKESSLDELGQAIDRVLRGEASYSPQIAYSMFARLAELSRERSRSERVEALELTHREMEILQLIAEGLSNRCIAEQLSLSVYTVKNHVHHVLKKLDVHDRRGAVEHAYARHWLKRREISSSQQAAGRGRD